MAFETGTAITIGISFTALILMYLGLKLKGDKHAPIQILFITIGLFVLLSGLGISSQMATDQASINYTHIQTIIDTDYTALMFSTIIFIIYLAIIFIFETGLKFGVIGKRLE